MNDDELERFIHRTLGANTSLGPRTSFRPTEAPQGSNTKAKPVFHADADYALAAQLGRGGMGIVYRARQPRLDRTVAVKTIRPESGGDTAIASFIDEARVTGHLSHPNIVPVIDLGCSSTGETYLAKKLVDGRSWEEFLGHDGSAEDSMFVDFEDDDAREKETTPEALPPRIGADLEPHLEIFLSVCNAVAFAHSRGFIHRDIKPANVMIGEFGEVLVMDWGLAVDISGKNDDDRPEIVFKDEINEPWGTPCYLAPEMARGEGKSLGPWTDIFLLGATLHEVVTGRPPHSGFSLAEMLRNARAPATPTYSDAVPLELQNILRRAMAPLPEDRYQTVVELQQALRDFQRHRESLVLTEAAQAQLRATTSLAAGRVEESSRQSRVYELYGSAIAGFEQALTLWPENVEAARGAVTARSSFATRALEAGDLALARAQAVTLPQDQCGDLIQRITNEENKRLHSRRTAIRLRRGIIAAVLVVIVSLGILAARWDDIERGRLEAERFRVESLLQEAFYELGEGSESLAADTFSRIIDSVDEAPDEAVAGLVLCKLRAGDLLAAKAVLDRYSSDIHDQRFGYIRTDLLVAMGQVDEAEALDRELGPPGDALGHFILGVRLSLSGHALEARGLLGDEGALEASAAVYRQSLAALTSAMLYSESLRGLYLFDRAHAAGHAKDEAAVKECAALLELRFGDSALAWFWAGFAYERLGGHPDETVRAFRRAFELDPDNPRYLFCLGTSLILQDPESALEFLTRANEMKADDPETLCNIGLVQVELGNFDAAVQAFKSGDELGRARGDDWHYPSANWLRKAKLLVETSASLAPTIESGQAELPIADPEMLLMIEEVAKAKHWEEGLTASYQRILDSASPTMHPNVFFRGACAALLAGDPKRARAGVDGAAYRQLALGWIGESLKRCRNAVQAGLLPKNIVKIMVETSLGDPGVDLVREGENLDRLPLAEQNEWRLLWDQARALLADLSE